MTEYHHELVPATDLPARLVDDIDNAEKPVYLQTMGLKMGSEHMGQVCMALIDAAQRGVLTTLAFDQISLKDTSPASRRKILNFCSTFTQAGGNVTLLGDKTWLPTPAGRSHSKFYSVGDIGYYGGGVNLTPDSFGHHDYMLRTKALAVGEALLRVAELSPPDVERHDAVLPIDSERTLLFDSGMRRSSVILEHTVQLAAQAEQVWYLSQFSPAPQIVKAMQARIPPSHITAKFNQPQNSGRPREWMAAYIDKIATTLHNSYTGKNRIHGKAFVARKPDGTLEAITGSHNFSGWGVEFGTKELALQTTSQADCEQLVNYIENI